MVSLEDKLKEQLDAFGKDVENNRLSISIKSTLCIDKFVPNSSGIYWIETTMPTERMREAISEIMIKIRK